MTEQTCAYCQAPILFEHGLWHFEGDSVCDYETGDYHYPESEIA